MGMIFGDDEDTMQATNIKKGIISLFQLRMEDGTHSEVSSLFTLFSFRLISFPVLSANAKAVINKLVSCTWLSSGVVEVWIL